MGISEWILVTLAVGVALAFLPHHHKKKDDDDGCDDFTNGLGGMSA